MNEINPYQSQQEEEYESPYCQDCGACGEPLCCPPEKCKYWNQYKTTYDELLKENYDQGIELAQVKADDYLLMPTAMFMFVVSLFLAIADTKLDHFGALILSICAITISIALSQIKNIWSVILGKRK